MGEGISGKVIKFTKVKGPEINLPYPVAASTVFKHLSGAFVYLDSNQRIALAGAAQTELLGWAFTGEWTSASTAGQTILGVNISLDAVYCMPLDAARTETQLRSYVGKTCDIITTSNIQYADFDASATDVLQIVGYEYWGSAAGEQGLWVKLNPTKVAATGVV